MTKILDSVIFGDNAEVFTKLITFYKPPPAKVIDVTCGYKRFWAKLLPSISSTGLISPNQNYDVVFSDIRPLGDIQADYRTIADEHPELVNKFDVVVFDPPYVNSANMIKVATGYKRWMNMDSENGSIYAIETEYGELTPEHMLKFLYQAYKLLKPGGIVIAKLQDTINWWHFKFYEKIEQFGLFELTALYIQYFGKNFMRHINAENRKKPAPVHAYWFILTKGEKK
jgi:hypothetical protein